MAKTAVFLCLAFLAVGSLAKRRGGDERSQMLQNNRPSKISVQEQRERLLSSACDDCKLIVQKVRFIADNPVALEEAKLAIDTVCRATLSGDELQECLKIADNLKTIIERFKPLLDNPQVFCEQIYLCGEQQDARTHIVRVILLAVKRQVFKVELSGRERNAICDECKFAVSEIKTVWDQKVIQQDVEESLESLCSSLGQYRDTCKDLIDQYWPTIVQFIDEELSDPNGACSSIGLCATRFAAVSGSRLFQLQAIPAALHRHAPAVSPLRDLIARVARTQTKEGNTASCAVCIFSFTTLLDSMKADLPNIAAKIEDVVDAAFPAEWGPNVDDFLGRFLQPVLLLTVEQISPKQLCSAISACRPHAFIPSMRQIEEMRLEDNGELVCESCRVLAAALKDELEQPEVRSAIQAQLQQICDFVPGEFTNECDNLVREKLPEIMALIAGYVEPSTFCPELGLCPNEGGMSGLKWCCGLLPWCACQ